MKDFVKEFVKGPFVKCQALSQKKKKVCKMSKLMYRHGKLSIDLSTLMALAKPSLTYETW